MNGQLPYSTLKRGSLLIASPDMAMSIYLRSVVLLCEHSSEGTFGLIINKPVHIELPEEVASLKQLANPRIGIRSGGPLQASHLMLLHSSPDLPDETLKVCEGAYLGGDLRFLQDAASKENGPELLLCFGYCGWGAGQLEREFLNGEWFLHPAQSRHLFSIPPEKLWQTLLREMGGKYASLSMIPQDLSLN